jgi:heterodisulfide reductase subunit D
VADGMRGLDKDGGDGYDPNGDGRLVEEFVAQWQTNAYGCFSSGHKFCREVCPVMQVTRNENHTPTAFHANIVAMEKGLVGPEDVADDYVHCTQCGACELRCPNTLFTGDFYRHRTRTVDVVKAMRALMVDTGNEREGWKLWNERLAERHNEPVLGDVPVSQEHVADWAEGLDIPVGGETILFVDCEAAFYRTSYTRAFAQLLQKAGVEFGLMREQWCCGGPAAEMGYLELARKHADHNVADWRAVGAKRIIAPDPHDYIAFTEDYPSLIGGRPAGASPRSPGDDYDFEIVLGVELVGDLVKEGRIQLTEPVERTVTYHDPCRLNKRKGVHEAPRELLRAVPGITFKDVDHVTQWSYCSGGGAGLPIEKPEITEEISRRRVARAQQLEVDTLISACPWSERPLSQAGAEADQPLEIMDLFELVARSAGIEVGGHSHAPAAEAQR